jgi:hypothetical protein
MIATALGDAGTSDAWKSCVPSGALKNDSRQTACG